MNNNLDRAKFIRQKEALTKWKNNDYRGTLNLTMRFGKTLCAKFAIEHFHRIIGSDNFHTLCISPNAICNTNLNNVLGILPNVECYTTSTLLNILKRFSNDDERADYMAKYDLLIIDELHKIIKPNTETAYYILPFIPVIDKVLGLTGSVLNKNQIESIIKYRIPVVDTITEEEAIAKGWVSQYKEYNLGIELEDHFKQSYVKQSLIISETLDMFDKLHKRLNKDYFKREIFNSEFDIAMSCFLGKYYRNPIGANIFIKPDIIRNMIAEIKGWNKDLVLDNDYNIQKNKYWHPDAIHDRCKIFKQVVKSRNELLICNRNKLNAVIDILNLNSVSTICFNESTEMADLEADHFTEEGIVYHSNVESRYVVDPNTGDYYKNKKGEPKKLGKTSLKRLAIEGMRDGTYKYLFTAKALNEGITIESIRQVIITGGDVNSQTHEQRTARGKSIDYTNFSKNCIVINLYIEDFRINDKLIKSRDKEKLMKRQGDRTNIVWVSSIDEIFN